MNIILFIIGILFIMALLVLFLIPMESSTRVAGALGAAATLLTAYTIFVELNKSNVRAAQEDIQTNESSYSNIYSNFASNPLLEPFHKELYSSKNSQAHSLMTVMLQNIDNVHQYYTSKGEPVPDYWENVFRDWVNTPTFEDTWDDVASYYDQDFRDYIRYLRKRGQYNILAKQNYIINYLQSGDPNLLEQARIQTYLLNEIIPSDKRINDVVNYVNEDLKDGIENQIPINEEVLNMELQNLENYQPSQEIATNQKEMIQSLDVAKNNIPVGMRRIIY